ncbi:ataxin-10 [Culex quinquefasciatus]|uniref:ataxin-10 n=1 Tax=Culex quinquefasciatus TaxID=7176 RepID=UPI0018E35A2B|nr:ataxin-10 [Culex quinquefasciatus]
MNDISKHLSNADFEAALKGLNELNISNCKHEDFQKESDELFASFMLCHGSSNEVQNKIALKSLNLLKRSCALGETFQNEIIAKKNFLSGLRTILEDEAIPENVRINCLQLLANLCVQNRLNQEAILRELKDFLLKSVENNCCFTNAATMIVYNAFIYKAELGMEVDELLEVLLTNVESNRLAQRDTPEFVSIFVEYLACESNEIVDHYEKVSFEKRILFLRYLIEYVRQDDRRSRPLHPDLFKHLLNDFKRKSDCVLKTVDSYLDQKNTEEVFTLLLLMSDATCVHPYESFIRADGALFLNLGCLLRQLQTLGKTDRDNIFAPVQSIGEILKVKQGTSELNIEQDISYSLKSALVKALANLSYRNKKNQNLAREMDIMAAILDCANLDARNPLIKEWSILAIRNLCEDNLENQKFVASLTKVGDAENSLITEYTAEGGTIRIRDGSTASQ